MLKSFGRRNNSTRLNMMDEEWLWAIFSRHALVFFYFLFLHKLDWFLLIEAWPMYPRWGLKEAREMDPRVHVHIEDNSVLVPIWLLWWSSFWNSLLRLTIVLKAFALQFTFETFVLVYMETHHMWITKFSSHQSVNGSPYFIPALQIAVLMVFLFRTVRL